MNFTVAATAEIYKNSKISRTLSRKRPRRSTENLYRTFWTAESTQHITSRAHHIPRGVNYSQYIIMPTYVDEFTNIAAYWPSQDDESEPEAEEEEGLGFLSNMWRKKIPWLTTMRSRNNRLLKRRPLQGKPKPKFGGTVTWIRSSLARPELKGPTWRRTRG